MSKKEELLRNAAKIIYTEGIQKLTMDYLAQVSNMTKGGVLYHFASKQQLLLQMNEMVIQQFENKMHEHRGKLAGNAPFTRAYAYATLEYVDHPETALLPAVLMTSLEDEDSFDLWKRVSEKWDKAILADSGNQEEKIQLKFICDGIWFSLMYNTNTTLTKHMTSRVLALCEALAKEED